METASYLVNISPSSALEDKTPQEVWTGKKNSLSHLRVFGGETYVHVPKEKTIKHIDVQYHFVRDMVEDKNVLLVKVDTLNNTADALTKSVSIEKFSWCREIMGVAGLD